MVRGPAAGHEQAIADTAGPSLADMTAVFARIGILSFGGPAGQIALMHRELVDERGWIGEERFLRALNFCMLLPGPEAQQLATYVGWLLHGTRGGLIAGTLFVLPGFLVMLGLSTGYALFQETDWLGGVFFGLKAAVLAVVVDALIRISRRALRSGFRIALAVAAFLAIYALDVPFPVIVVMAGVFGYWDAAFRKDATGVSALPHAAPVTTALAERPIRDALRSILTWIAVWIAPVAVLAAVFGRDSVYMAIAAFFSKMAVVTFGGAYAVLAYVAQEAVATFGWLAPGEMIDGLALAETTPGPLVLVLTFVGYLAAARSPGLLDPIAAGTLGAALTAWVTFVPCFLWIFLGAPYVERLSADRRLAAAMGAITAAVVGVILNLTVWFALHVLFRDVGTLDLGLANPAWPVFASLDPAAAAIAVLAAILLFALRVGMVPTLAVCGAAGFLLGLIGKI